MKKLFALLLSAMLLMSLFAGCSNTGAVETTGNTTQAAAPAGTLVITMGAAFEIVYDSNGNALEINGTNETGKTIAQGCQQNVGRACVFAVRALLRYASDNKLIGDAKSMAVRVKHGDPLPSEDFLDTIITDTQYLADEESTGIRMAKLDADDLDDSGMLTPEAAKYLAARYLDTIEADLAGEDVAAEGVYTFTFGEKSCTVDAMTGLVTAK